MRIAELLFVGFLVLYQGARLLPRFRRSGANLFGLMVCSGLAAAMLAFDGLRWQQIPSLGLLLGELIGSVVSLGLRVGRRRQVNGGWFRQLSAGVLATVCWLVSWGGILLVVLFPLPPIHFTGGATPAYRQVVLPPQELRQPLTLDIWYPTSKSKGPTISNAGQQDLRAHRESQGGLPQNLTSYLTRWQTGVQTSGQVSPTGQRHPVILVAVPKSQQARDFSIQWADLASRGYVVVGARPTPSESRLSAPVSDFVSSVRDELLSLADLQKWVEPDLTYETATDQADYGLLGDTREALRQLNSDPSDRFYDTLDLGRVGLWAWDPSARLPEGQKFVAQVLLDAKRAPSNESVEVSTLSIVSDPTNVHNIHFWEWTIPNLKRSEVSDAAFLNPLVALENSRIELSPVRHTEIREYTAAFFAAAFWGRLDDFRNGISEIPGTTLTGR